MQQSNGSFNLELKPKLVAGVMAEVMAVVRLVGVAEVRVAGAGVTASVGIVLSVSAARPTRSKRRMRGCIYYSARMTP